MANKSVLELAVGTGQWDAGLKKAKQALDNFTSAQGGLQQALEKDNGDMTAFIKMMSNMDSTAKTTKQQLREMSNVLTDFTATYRTLTDEQKKSPFGQELAKGIQTLTERAGVLRDAMDDVQLSVRNAASDTRIFDQMAQGMSVATAGFQGLTGAGKLLGIEMGNDVEVIAKLQAAMAVTNSLTTIQTALQKQSALMQGVQAVQATAAATAQALYAKNTALATAAGAAFNAVAKANPYVLLASAVAAVGVALVGFSKNAKKATEATEEETEAMKQAARMADIWKNTMGSTYSSLMTKYDELKRQWQSLSSEHSKTDWIKKNKTALHDLGGAVNDVKSAEDFFNNNTDAVVQSFVRRAQAAARVAQLTELYRKQIELLDKKSQASAAITADAQNSGRSAKAGDIIEDQTYRSSKYGKVNAQGNWVFTEQGAKLYSGTDTSSASSVMKIDVEIEANQSEIEKVKNQITNEFKDISVVGGGNGQKGDTKTTKETKTEEILPEGSFADLQKKMQELRKEQSKVTDPTEWQIYASIIEDVTNKMDELQGKTKQAIPDMKLSKSAQADLNFEMGPLNLDAIDSYIGNIKSALKEADLGTPLYESLTEKLKDATMFQSVLTQAIAGGASAADLSGVAQEIKQKLLEGDIDETAWQEFLDKINEYIQNADLKLVFDVDTKSVTTAVKQQKKETAEMAKNWQAAGSAIQAVGSAMQQIEDPAAKVLGTIAQAVATMALSYAQAAASPAVTGTGWGWIAFAATGVATMLSSIAAIKNATHFAQGGIVGGSDYTDNTPIMVSSGELILNRAQQGNLASQLEGGGIGNLHLETVISGEDIRVVLKNNGRRTGRGEYITSRNSRS